MAASKKEFTLGAVLMVGFLIVLAAMFMPLYHGHNAMEYMDNLYNSISKASADYVPEMTRTAQGLRGETLDAQLRFGDAVQAERTARMLTANGAQATAEGTQVSVQGDLGVVLTGAMADAQAMYDNDGAALRDRYGYDERAAMYNWWVTAGAMEKILSKEKRFETAKQVASIKSKAMETAFNYYGIQAESISANLLIVVGSLVFYVIYTLWYGFSILFMFEGAGFRLEH